MKEYLELDDRFDYLIEERPRKWVEAEREIIGDYIAPDGNKRYSTKDATSIFFPTREEGYKSKITKPATEAAKAMEGAYVGFQPKPAVEIILVLSKGKTLTWLDDCRIPYQSEDDKNASQWLATETTIGLRKWSARHGYDKIKKELEVGNPPNEKGRFPANLLVSDDCLNSFSSGEYSRYFSLDAWKTFPFIITPKASRSERGEFNNHPTVKSLKLMSYLITMGSREGDLVLDPFCGSGTVCIAADQLHRKWLGMEMNPEYTQIIKKRLMIPLSQLKLTTYS